MTGLILLKFVTILAAVSGSALLLLEIWRQNRGRGR